MPKHRVGAILFRRTASASDLYYVQNWSFWLDIKIIFRTIIDVLEAVVPSSLKDKKVAIVCDWLTSPGAERVVLALHELFPKVPIYTSQYDPNQIDWFKNAEVRTSMAARVTKTIYNCKLLPVLRRQAFQSLDLTEFDIVISSSGAS
ncbi:MAG: sugar transferase [Candidatus Saccharimonadales bacterium]